MTEASPNKWHVLLLVGVGIFMTTLDSSIVNLALPTIMSELEVPFSTIEWVVVVYMLTIGACLLAFGRLSDIRGRRWVFVRGLAIFTAGSFLCGMAPSAGFLIASRSAQAIGSAMVMACTPALIVDSFPPHQRGRGLGLVGTIVAGGLTTGPALGGIILEITSWRAIFYVNIPVGITAMLLTRRILPVGTRKQDETFDWPGAILWAAGLVCLLYAGNRARSWGVDSPATLGLVAVAVVLGIGLFVAERRAAHPMIDPEVFSIRLFSAAAASAVLMFACLFAIVFLMPFFLINPAGFSSGRAGAIMVIPFFFLFVGSPVSGSLADRIGSRLLCTLGLGLLAASLFSLSALTVTASDTQIFLRLACAGAGVALFASPNNVAAMNAVPPFRRGLASATVATARNVGMVLGVATAASVFDHTFIQAAGHPFREYDPTLLEPFMTAFGAAMFTAGCLGVAGMIVAFLRGPEKIAARDGGA